MKFKVLLGGPVGKKLKSMLDDRIIIPNELLQEDDEYHLILEYPRGEVWGEMTSSCANRFIISHDKANGEMLAMDKFFGEFSIFRYISFFFGLDVELIIFLSNCKIFMFSFVLVRNIYVKLFEIIIICSSGSLESYKPDLVVISGLHLLEGQTAELQKNKLEDLRHHLRSISEDTPIHLELASMTSSTLMKDIAFMIFPMVDSVGLNEQELAFLSSSLDGPGGQVELVQSPPEIGQLISISVLFIDVA